MQVPPTIGVVEEHESVGVQPLGLQGRSVWATGDGLPLLDTAVHESTETELGAIPWHGWMIPGDPGEVGSVGRNRGVGDEVTPRHHGDDLIHIARGRTVARNSHDVASGNAGPCVVFSDRPQLSGGEPQSTESHPRPGRCQGARLRIRGEDPDPLVSLLDEAQRAVIRRCPRAAAVLVHTRPSVPRGGQELFDSPIGQAPSDCRAPILGWNALSPPDLLAVWGRDERRTFVARGRRGNGCCGDRRRPGAVGEPGKEGSHGPHATRGRWRAPRRRSPRSRPRRPRPPR